MLSIHYFTASWCMPCRSFRPILMKVTGELGIDVMVVDVDNNIATADAMGIKSVPTLVVYDDDDIVDKIIGAFPEKELRMRLMNLHG